MKIVQRMIAAGFTFAVRDGEVEYRRPADDSAEVDELLGLVAWNWDQLEPIVLHQLVAQPTACVAAAG